MERKRGAVIRSVKGIVKLTHHKLKQPQDSVVNQRLNTRYGGLFPRKPVNLTMPLKPLGKVVPAPSGVETADAVEDFPDGDGRETNPLPGDPIEKLGNP